MFLLDARCDGDQPVAAAVVFVKIVRPEERFDAITAGVKHEFELEAI